MRVFVGAGLVVLGTVVAAVPAAAQIGTKKEADRRIAPLLEKADLKYEIDKDGDYKLINNFDDDRSQLIFINSRTTKLGTLEIREIWSVGYISDGVVPDEVLKDLLEENARVKLGGWEVRSFSGREAGVFRAQIAADTDEVTLLLTMQAVSKTADQKEKELMSKDDL